MFELRRISAGVLALTLITTLSATSLSHAETARVSQLSFDTSELEVRNLIGEITVSGHGGSGFEIVATLGGKDATGSDLEFLREESGGRGVLTVKFPETRKYVYPRLGKGSKTQISKSDGDRSWLGEVLEGLFGGGITVSGSGSGLEVWVDLEIRVPAGGTLEVRHGVGQLRANDVDGNLELAIRSGHVGAEAISGDLEVETGSGHVEVARIDGRLAVATGSGHVDVRELRASGATIATGSGHVDLEQVDSPSLTVATGSGGVTASGLSADNVEIGTGSGAVRVQLDRMGGGEFEIGTGSGRVVLEIPDDASIDVHAETGSGSIDLDIRGEMSVSRKDRDEVEFTLGGGESRVRIGTGSGGIRIAHHR